MESKKEAKLIDRIVQKAWSDNAFKQELLNNPLETIERLAGRKINLPEDKSIAVQDQTNSSIIYINIPVEPNMDDMELNEEQLEIVAGGGVIPTPILQLNDPFDGLN